MPRELLRLILLVLLIGFLVSDIIELLSYLPSNSIYLTPLFSKINQKSKNDQQQQQGTSSKPIIRKSMSDEELKDLEIIKTKIVETMKDSCLPKLVCELHASLNGDKTLTELENNLLTLIKDTSLGTSGNIVSQYHFAAHMGQLLSGVEGNGCHNLYPSCPLSGKGVLQIVKKVRVK